MSKNRTRTKDKYRVVYNELQRMELENEFGRNEYIAIPRKQEIAQRLQLSERQIKIWFQNRRAKKRKQQKRRQGNQQQQPQQHHHHQQPQPIQPQQQPIRVSTTEINNGNSSDDLYAIQQQHATVSPQIATSPAIIAAGQHQQFHQGDPPTAPALNAPPLPASVSPYTAHPSYADGYHSHSHHHAALSHHLHDINHHHQQQQPQQQPQQHPHHLQAQHHHTHHAHQQAQQQQHHQHPHHHYAHHYGQQHYQYHHHHLNQEQHQSQEASLLQPTAAEYQQYQHPAMAGQHQHGYHLPSTIDIGQPI